MIYQNLSRANLRISRIGLGTVQFGLDYGLTKEKSQDEVDAILKACCDQGLNFLDTARDYGDSEDKIGHFIQRHGRQPFVIATKLGKMEKEVVNNSVHLAKHIQDSIKTSLQKLGAPIVDILLLHQTDDFFLESPIFWGVIEELRAKKLFRLFGISVYEPEQTRIWVTRRSQHIDCVQLPYSVFDQRFETILPLLKDKKIDVISRSAFLKGMIPAQENELPSELKAIKPWQDKLKIIAQDIGLSLSELALGFVLTNKLITSTILGVDSSKELNSNIRCLGLLEKIAKRYDELEGLRIEDESLIDPRRWRQI